MAEYSLELNEAGTEKSTLKIVAQNESWAGRHFLGHQTRAVIFKEVATGVLKITEMSEIETEIVKRGLFATESPSSWSPPIVFTEPNKVAKLEQLESGALTTIPTLNRTQRLPVDRSGAIVETDLTRPYVRSFSGNLLGVRTLMLEGVREEYRKDGQAQEGHFVEVAINAQRMAHEIREEVEPQLLALHGVTIAMIQDQLVSDSLERVSIGIDQAELFSRGSY